MKRSLILLVMALSLMLLVFGCTTKMLRLHTITATAGPGGNIVPSGSVRVVHGSSQTFQFVPDNFSVINEVAVDGASIGQVSIYAFQDVTRDHTIHVVFESYPKMLGLWQGAIIDNGEETEVFSLSISSQSVAQYDGQIHALDGESWELVGLLTGVVTIDGDITINVEAEWDSDRTFKLVGVVSDNTMSGTIKHYFRDFFRWEAVFHLTRQ